MVSASCEKALSQVVAKAWSDAAFKQRLLAGPVAVLRAEGVDVPEGRQVRVVEEGDTLKLQAVEESETLSYLILPAKPSEEHVELRWSSGGAYAYCYGCGCHGCHCRHCGGCH